MIELEEKVISRDRESSVDYNEIVSSKEFSQLLSDKKKFIIPYTILFMAYSLILPFLALHTEILDGRVIGDITWAWIYGLSFIPVSLIICSIYVKKSAQFDEQARKIIEKEGL